MALYRKDVLVRPNSTISEADAINWTRNWLNNFQNADENKDEDGKYKNYFFADIFFAKNKKIIRVFSDACKDAYNMQADENGLIEFTLLDVQQINNKIQTLDVRVDTIENTSSQTEAEVI